MLSAIKRLTSKGDGSPGNSNSSTMPPGHQSMSTSLQRKFARGVQYNMKVIIKGDRNVGKTCLFHRLQGQKFIEEYFPTEEIQVTSIQWNYKATDDIVKVEVWDVVDRGKKKKRFEGLKLDNSQLEITEEPALDAEFLDVYKGTNGVILMMDITKSWTFDYVQKELPKIPDHIPVIVLANHCDMSHHRTVSQNQISYFIESVQNRSAQIRYTESSMRNGFGLKLLHKFFNLPFLQLQRVTLLQQIERNQHEIDLTTQELDMYLESDEADYDKFLDNLANRRRQIADSNSVVAQKNNGDSMKKSVSGPIVIGAGQPIPHSLPQMKNSQKNTESPLNTEDPKPSAKKALNYNEIEIKSSQSMPTLQTNNNSPSGFMSKLFGNKSQQSAEQCLPEIGKIALDSNPITSVEEFCPDGGQLDRSFLEDAEKESPGKTVYEALDSDSDDDKNNPLVAGFQDDLDPDDNYIVTKSKYTQIMTNNISPSPEAREDNTYTESSYKVSAQRGSISSNDVEISNEFKIARSETHEDTAGSDVSEKNSEKSENWITTDLKWRRSPEGGEDVSNVSQTLDFSGGVDDSGSITSSNVNMELLTSKHSCNESNSDFDLKSEKKKEKKKSDKDKTDKKSKKSKEKEKHSKSKLSDKEKDKNRSSKKKRSRDETSSRKQKSEYDELEEFLNGPSEPRVDQAYEAF